MFSSCCRLLIQWAMITNNQEIKQTKMTVKGMNLSLCLCCYYSTLWINIIYLIIGSGCFTKHLQMYNASHINRTTYICQSDLLHYSNSLKHRMRCSYLYDHLFKKLITIGQYHCVCLGFT